MLKERASVIDDIITCQHTISRAIMRPYSSAWMEIDLSMAQLKVLMTLYKSGALPIGQVAETLNVGQPTASHLVERLVQIRLVVRTEDPQDRRRTFAQLSSEGEALAERLNRVRVDFLRNWLIHLDDTALEALLYGLQSLAEVAQAETNPPASDQPSQD